MGDVLSNPGVLQVGEQGRSREHFVSILYVGDHIAPEAAFTWGARAEPRFEGHCSCGWSSDRLPRTAAQGVTYDHYRTNTIASRVRTPPRHPRPAPGMEAPVGGGPDRVRLPEG